MRVLVVDDDPEILDLARFLLEPDGYQVLGVSSGDEALPALAEQRFDLVIADVAMAGVDGVELCRRIRADANLRHLPVLMLTAVAGEEVRADALAAGANGYLTKPFGVDELLRQVRLHVRRS